MKGMNGATWPAVPYQLASMLPPPRRTIAPANMDRGDHRDVASEALWRGSIV